MLVTICPRCGRPVQARLVTPEAIDCVACGYAGPPPAEARDELLAARAQLFGAAAHARQLSEARKRALARDESRRFAIVFLLAGIPSTLVFYGAVEKLRAWNSGSESVTSTIVATIVFTSMWLLGLLIWASVARWQRRLRAACAATPPARVGDPSSCRLCGAGLPAGESVVRCRYCGADNFAAAEVSARIGAQQQFDARRFREAIEHEVRATRRASSDARVLVLGAAVAVPLAGSSVLGGLEPLLMRMERDVDGQVLYASAATRDGECVGRLARDAEASAASFDFGTSRLQAAPPGPLAEVMTARATALRGMSVHTARSAVKRVQGVVERVYGSPVGNLARVRTVDGKVVRLDVRGLCLAGVRHEPVAHGGSPGAVTLRGDKLLRGTFGRIVESDLAGRQEKTFAPLPGAMPSVVSGDPAQVFVADARQHVIWSLPARPERGAAAYTTVLQAPSGQEVLHFAASPGLGGRIVVSGPAYAMRSARKDGSDEQKLDTSFTLLRAVAVDGDDAFVSGRGGSSPGLYRFRGSATAGERLGSPCEAIAVDATAVYCGEGRGVTAIDRASGQRRVVFELPPPILPPSGYVETVHAVAVDAHAVYFVYTDSSTFEDGGILFAVPKRGGAAYVVATALPRPRASVLLVSDEALFVEVSPTNQFGQQDVVRLMKRTGPRLLETP